MASVVGLQVVSAKVGVLGLDTEQAEARYQMQQRDRKAKPSHWTLGPMSSDKFQWEEQGFWDTSRIRIDVNGDGRGGIGKVILELCCAVLGFTWIFEGSEKSLLALKAQNSEPD